MAHTVEIAETPTGQRTVIDFQGRLLANAGEFAGMAIEARPKIVEKLAPEVCSSKQMETMSKPTVVVVER